VIADSDLSRAECGRIKVGYGLGATRDDRKFKHLVEVAIVQPSVRRNAHPCLHITDPRVAALIALLSRGLILFRRELNELSAKSSQRNVCHRVESIECYTELAGPVPP